MPDWYPPRVAAGPHDRRPAVAGSFYPGDPGALGRLVDNLLAAVDAVAAPYAPETAPPAQATAPYAAEPLGRAYLVPHAGYRYSGPVAAHAYARIRAHAGAVRRVVLIGPAHHIPVRGCVVSTAENWLTPLGPVPVDLDAVNDLINGGFAAVGDGPHLPEHSLEVQLPFLQRALPPGVPIVPVLAGAAPPGEVADALAAADDRPGTLVLCSTDLSHYLDEASATTRDRATVRAILDLAPDRVGARDACGAYAARGLITLAGRAGLWPRLLYQGTSADTGGDRDRVVGYAAVAFDAPDAVPGAAPGALPGR